MKFHALFCAVAALSFAGCAPRPATLPVVTSDAGQAQPQTEAPPPAPTPAPAATPSKFYSYEENGTFGYEQAQSDDDRAHNVAAQPMVLIRYDGHRGDMYAFKRVQGTEVTVLSCHEPCTAMKLETYAYGGLTTNVMPIAPGTILDEILQDARNGFLDHGIPGAQQKG